jgi:hypothetical protein
MTQRFLHGRVGNGHDTRRQLRHPAKAALGFLSAQKLFEAPLGRVAVERKLAAQEVVRVEAAEQQVGIGHRG